MKTMGWSAGALGGAMLFGALTAAAPVTTSAQRSAPRARLGVTVSSSQDAADDAKGARVQSVMEDGPGVDGRILLGRIGDLGDRLRETGPDDRSWQLVSPDGRGRPRFFTDSARVRSWRCPGDSDTAMGAFRMGDDCIGGLRLIAINPGLAEYFKTDKGVLVSDVEANSPVGLQPGDVILQIGGRDATNPERARRILATYSASEAIDFHIIRKGKAMDVRGHLGS